MATDQIIAVMGGTGSQGGGVVDALLEREQFGVRVLTRNPQSDKSKALAERGVAAVEADLTRPETLEPAFAGAYGAFIVTNFWDPATQLNETEQGMAAVRAARAAGVKHCVWSTLPNCREISGGKYEVVHFTGKAMVDTAVRDAGFEYYTFVEAPMYLQNLTGMMAPQPVEDGGSKKAWAIPMTADSRCMHVGDVHELGKLVARVFETPEQNGQGRYLSMAGGLYSWQDLIDELNRQGHDIVYNRVPAEAYDQFYPGAAQLREMMEYFEEYTYFGPGREAKVAAANELVPEGFTSFADWARANMAP